MKGKTQAIVVALCVLITLGITLVDFKTSQDDLLDKVKDYQEITAVVKKVHAPSVTRYGSKQPTYDLQVRLKDGTAVTLYRRKLNGKVQEGSSIAILYNPESLQDEVYLKE